MWRFTPLATASGTVRADVALYPARYRERYCKGERGVLLRSLPPSGTVTADVALYSARYGERYCNGGCGAVTMDYPDFNDEHTPLGYLITFRTYGTWLHGDARGSVDRRHQRYGSPFLPPSPRRRQIERSLFKQPPVRLDRIQRTTVEFAIRETCTLRRWHIWALNVRTNHVHCVVTANGNASNVLGALKANATRAMRDAGCWRSDLSPWSARGSKRYLWTEKALADASVYVAEEQGE